jgi:nucleoid-associated protein YgaU
VQSAVDFAAMADLEDQDDDPLVLNVADNAVVANAVAPEAAELRALQGIADTTRIVESGDSLSQKRR